jgi:hypothetical protein
MSILCSLCYMFICIICIIVIKISPGNVFAISWMVMMMMMMMTSCIMLFLFLHDPMLNMFMCLWVSIKIVQRCLPVVCYVLNRKLTEKRRRRQKLPTFVIIYYFTKDWYILSPPLSTQFPTSFHWTCYCTFYFYFLFICVIVCGHFELKLICAAVCLYMYWR